MKRIIAILLVLGIFVIASPACANTWLGGSNMIDSTGTYGVQGIADPNNMPGARFGAAAWTWPNGDLGMFGGIGFAAELPDGRLNDLWKYDGTHWTWLRGSDTTRQPGIYGDKGVADPNNIPGARYGHASWVDDAGNVWIFGGEGSDSTGSADYLNDLWKFDGANWTWMSGSNVRKSAGHYGVKGLADPNNMPPARTASVTWTDAAGDLWLFGGFGLDSSDSGFIVNLNDLWKYDVSEDLWTWIDGSDLGNQPGFYGDKGTTHVDNMPGARQKSVVWQQSNGDVFLFGGAGMDAMGTEGALSDLWIFDGAEWTWISGAEYTGMPGNFGDKGVTAPTNQPYPRWEAAGWIDETDRLWLFGGNTWYGGFNIGMLNDLWMFDGANWTWMDGSDALNRTGIYGTQGTDDPDNMPGARYGSMTWYVDDTMYLFGGAGYAITMFGGALNDLWMLNPPCISPPGDLDGDCLVNLLDAAVLSRQWTGDLNDLIPLCQNWLLDNR